MRFLRRDKKSFASIFSNSFIISLIMLSVYWHVGIFPNVLGEMAGGNDSKGITDYNEFLNNIRGISLNLSNQLAMSGSVSTVFSVPLLIPSLKRELASKMYSPSAYFLGRYFSNILMQCFYPIIMVTIVYFGLDLNMSVASYLTMMGYSFIGNWVFCGQGYFIGIATGDAAISNTINTTLYLILFPSTGVMVNLKTANWFVKGMALLSPLRYVNEGFFRLMSRQVPDLVTEDLTTSRDIVLDNMGYNLGDFWCVVGLVSWMVLWIILSLVVINRKYSKL
mmetsp:Transcript_9995/g.15126  ORF Transcript_9995/g.15126 Transcript_9995/m.15126 type:complete len:279 (-) Transcript_9995:40-876(-)